MQTLRRRNRNRRNAQPQMNTRNLRRSVSNPQTRQAARASPRASYRRVSRQAAAVRPDRPRRATATPPKRGDGRAADSHAMLQCRGRPHRPTPRPPGPARAELPAAARRQAEWVLLMLGRLMSGSVRLMSGRHQACAAAAHERWAYVSLGLVETRRKGGLSESPPTRTLDAGPSVCLL